MKNEKMDFRNWQKDNLPKEEIDEIYNNKNKEESLKKSTGENHQPKENLKELEDLKNRSVEIDLELEKEQRSEKLTELSQEHNEVEKKIKEIEQVKKAKTEQVEEATETSTISLAEELGVKIGKDFRSGILRLEKIKNGEEKVDANFVREFHEKYLASDDSVSINEKKVREKTRSLYEDVNKMLGEGKKGEEEEGEGETTPEAVEFREAVKEEIKDAENNVVREIMKEEKVNKILFLVEEKFELLKVIDQELRIKGSKNQEIFKENHDKIEKIEEDIKVLYDELGSVGEIEKILGDDLDWKKGRLISEIKSIAGEVEEPKETESAEGEDLGVEAEKELEIGNEEEPEISREVLERLEKIDDRIEKARRGIEEIESKNEKRTEEMSREDAKEKEEGDTMESELDKVRINDLKRDEARYELEKVEIQLQDLQSRETISEEEKALIKKLKGEKSELKEEGRVLILEAERLVGLWKDKMDGGLKSLELETEKAEKKISGEKKSALDKLTFGLLGKKKPEAAETETPVSESAESGTETVEPEKRSETDAFMSAFGRKKKTAEGEEEKGRWENFKEIFGGSSRKIAKTEMINIEGAKNLDDLKVVMGRCAESGKLKDETMKFFEVLKNNPYHLLRGEQGEWNEIKNDLRDSGISKRWKDVIGKLLIRVEEFYNKEDEEYSKKNVEETAGKAAAEVISGYAENPQVFEPLGAENEKEREAKEMSDNKKGAIKKLLDSDEIRDKLKNLLEGKKFDDEKKLVSVFVFGELDLKRQDLEKLVNEENLEILENVTLGEIGEVIEKIDEAMPENLEGEGEEVKGENAKQGAFYIGENLFTKQAKQEIDSWLNVLKNKEIRDSLEPLLYFESEVRPETTTEKDRNSFLSSERGKQIMAKYDNDYENLRSNITEAIKSGDAKIVSSSFNKLERGDMFMDDDDSAVYVFKGGSETEEKFYLYKLDLGKKFTPSCVFVGNSKVRKIEFIDKE